MLDTDTPPATASARTSSHLAARPGARCAVQNPCTDAHSTSRRQPSAQIQMWSTQVRSALEKCCIRASPPACATCHSGSLAPAHHRAVGDCRTFSAGRGGLAGAGCASSQVCTGAAESSEIGPSGCSGYPLPSRFPQAVFGGVRSRPHGLPHRASA